jgi:cation diffusion facilitator CzcD-associated flavoprotein CzcO
VKRMIKRQMPDKPELIDKVIPKYTLGCKRVLLSNDYYAAFNRQNVDLVTSGLKEIKDTSVITGDGKEIPCDVLIWATGFAVHRNEHEQLGQMIGRAKVRLNDQWKKAMSAYRGTTVRNMPNFAFLMGPNTGLGHNTQIFMIESQLSYIMSMLRYMEKNHLSSIEPYGESEDEWNARVQKKTKGTVWVTGGCKSWYLTKDGYNASLWPDFTFNFMLLLEKFDPEHYLLDGVYRGKIIQGVN